MIADYCKVFVRIAVVRTEFAARRKDFAHKSAVDRIAAGYTSVDRTAVAAYMANYTEVAHTELNGTAFPEFEQRLLQRKWFENMACLKMGLSFPTDAKRRMRMANCMLRRYCLTFVL